MKGEIFIVDIIESWFEQAKKLDSGESLFLECHSKADARSMLRKFKHIRSEYEKINPILTSTIELHTTFKDKKFWLVITKLSASPLVGFKKDMNGNLIKITLENDIDRERRIKLMIVDGMNLEEIKQNVHDLTNEEIELYFKKED